MYNQAHQVNYTVGYVCFIKGNGYLDNSTLDYNAVNCLTPADFLHSPSETLYHLDSVKYMLSHVMEQYFGKQMRYQKIKVCLKETWLPKYRKWSMPLEHMQCAVQKADIIPLPTLLYNEASISATIEIIRELAERLRLNLGRLWGKKIMFKGDLLTIRNIMGAIYRKQEEPTYMDSFAWIEPIAGVFYLQMTLLKMLLITFWGESSDVYLLQRFSTTLPGRNSVTKDAKDFHSCDDFFRTIIYSTIIALFMHESGCQTIKAFETWLCKNNWPQLIKSIAEKHLTLTNVYSLRDAGKDQVAADVEITLVAKKDEWRIKKKKGDRQPNWVNRRVELTENLFKGLRDLVRENALLLASCGLLHLDFADACHGGYSGRLEMCI